MVIFNTRLNIFINFHIEINQCCSVTLIFNIVTILTFCFLLKSDGTVLSLSTHHPSVQKEIVNKHNALRRMVNPTASNMLKMVRPVLSMAH